MIAKGCIYHLVWFRDMEFEAPTLKSVPIVNEFLKLFPNSLPNITPKREINFSIDLLPYAHPIYILPYRMCRHIIFDRT